MVGDARLGERVRTKAPQATSTATATPRPRRGGQHERQPASVDWIRGRVRIDGPLPCTVSFEQLGDWEMLLPHKSESCDEM